MSKNVWYRVPSIRWMYDLGGPEKWTAMPLEVMEIEPDDLPFPSPIRRFCLRDFRRNPMPLDQNGELNIFICQLASLNEMEEITEDE